MGRNLVSGEPARRYALPSWRKHAVRLSITHKSLDSRESLGNKILKSVNRFLRAGPTFQEGGLVTKFTAGPEIAWFGDDGFDTRRLGAFIVFAVDLGSLKAWP